MDTQETRAEISEERRSRPLLDGGSKKAIGKQQAMVARDSQSHQLKRDAGSLFMISVARLTQARRNHFHRGNAASVAPGYKPTGHCKKLPGLSILPRHSV